MLNALRQSSGSWVVKIFLGLLVLSFAAWGIGDIFRLQPDAAVVTVGDTTVSGNEFLNDFNRQVRRMQRSLGPAFDAQQARQLGMVDQVIQQTVTRALYDQEVAELELTMSDSDIVAWIKRSSAFKNSFGQFDRLRFEQVIAENGFSEQGYITASRRDLSRDQLFSSVMGGTRSPDAMVKVFYQFQEETRLFEVLSLPYDKVVDISAPTDGDLNAYHEANKEQFRAPEVRALSYLTLRPEHLLDEVLATEREVADAYEARMNEFTTPPSREIEQIVVAEEALARKIAGRLKDGRDFYAVARELARDEIGQRQILEQEMEEFPLVDFKGEIVIALTAVAGLLASATTGATGRALDPIALLELPIAGVNDVALAATAMLKTGFGKILAGDGDALALFHFLDRAPPHRIIDRFTNMAPVAIKKPLPVHRALVAAIETPVDDIAHWASSGSSCKLKVSSCNAKYACKRLFPTRAAIPGCTRAPPLRFPKRARVVTFNFSLATAFIAPCAPADTIPKAGAPASRCSHDPSCDARSCRVCGDRRRCPSG